MTPKKLAEIAGVTPQYARMLMAGERRCSPELAKHLEKTLRYDRRRWIWPEDFPNKYIKSGNSEV